MGACSGVEALRHIWPRTYPRTQKSRGALRSVDEGLGNQLSGSSASVGRAVRVQAGVPLRGSRPVKKALAPAPCQLCWPGAAAVRSRTASRWKVPRVGEHRASSRRCGVARPSRWRRLASAQQRPAFAPGEGGVPLSARLSGQGERVIIATGGARSGARLGRSLRGEQSPRGAPRSGVPQPLTSSPSGGCPRSGRPSSRLAVVPIAHPGGRDVRAVRGRARGDMILQKPQERTRPRAHP